MMRDEEGEQRNHHAVAEHVHENSDENKDEWGAAHDAIIYGVTDESLPVKAIRMDGEKDKMPDSEKITINMNAVDLGKIDLLVQEGVYSNRTDFIRTAIRSQLERHTLEVQQSIQRHSYVIGVLSYNRSELERIKSKGERIKITVVGLLNIAGDVTPELAAEVIESVQVRGVFNALEVVKIALAGRMK
jgi:Arc/MetJ-type ribon-helix-helix transcriptional regulator